ncbi:MAG: cyclase family protein, partial [Actinobacteria bacterium]|nr:cyclase family protein [Actinomycetota bacterium]
MRFIDISPTVRAESPVWPGDSPFELAAKWSIGAGDSVSVGTVTTTTHIGAHIDAPAHVVAGAPTIDETPLDACIGPCLVVDVSDLVDRSRVPHGQVAAEAVRVRAGAGDTSVERLLLRHYPAPQREWDPALPGIDPALMRWFAAQGGRLLGIDLASFDPAESKELAAHRVGVEHGV